MVENDLTPLEREVFQTICLMNIKCDVLVVSSVFISKHIGISKYKSLKTMRSLRDKYGYLRNDFSIPCYADSPYIPYKGFSITADGAKTEIYQKIDKEWAELNEKIWREVEESFNKHGEIEWK